MLEMQEFVRYNLVSMVLGTEPRALCMLGRHSTNRAIHTTPDLHSLIQPLANLMLYEIQKNA